MKLSFFLNAYNFLVLYSLCKLGDERNPLSFEQWHNYLSTIRLGIHSIEISAFQIEQQILRCGPSPPQIQRLKEQTRDISNHISKLSVSKKIKKLINFGLFWPCKSSSPLCLYSPITIKEQLLEITTIYLNNQVTFNEDTEELEIPQIFQWYKDDFCRTNDTNEIIYFIIA